MSRSTAAFAIAFGFLASLLVGFCGLTYLQAQQARALAQLSRRVNRLEAELALERAQASENNRALSEMIRYHQARLAGFGAGLDAYDAILKREEIAAP